MMNDSFEYSLGIGPEQHPAAVDDDADRTAHGVLAGLRAGGDASAEGGDMRSAAVPFRALGRAIQYINDNLDSRLSWGAIGAAIGLSSFRFGRDFKRSTGVTPHQYVLRCRVKRAMKLLSDSDLSIADTALEVGCSCQSHFTTLFRKHTGMTPGAFRRAAEASRRRLFGAPAVAAGRRFGRVRDCGLIPRGPSGSELDAFATGARANDINQQMREVARALTASERGALAGWYGEQQHPAVATAGQSQQTEISQ